VAKGGPDVQRSYGLVSCSEWTGVPLSLLLTEVGRFANAAYFCILSGSRMTKDPMQSET
jgi:hypothetical protein